MVGESASHTCQCGRRFRTLADEYSDHPCPSCGYNPSSDTLAEDVAAYVEQCRENGSSPDAFAFSITYQSVYGRMTGEVITQLIDEELARYDAINERV